jgi:hypothetical protein
MYAKRCCASTVRGYRCKNNKKYEGFCFIHQICTPELIEKAIQWCQECPQIEQKIQAAKRRLIFLRKRYTPVAQELAVPQKQKLKSFISMWRSLLMINILCNIGWGLLQ